MGERLRDGHTAPEGSTRSRAARIIERIVSRRATQSNRSAPAGEQETMALPGEGIVGREAELEAIELLLDPVGAGPAAAEPGLSALLLLGEPGIGKTTLWREGIARASARGYRTLSCRGSPAEVGLSFAALGDLLAPLEPEAYESLPGPQRHALDVALLRAEAGGAAPDPRAIGTAVVSLLSRLAAGVPVLLALDDAQWLDPPSVRTLAFALRRLESSPIAVLGTRRLGEHESPDELFVAVPVERVHRVRLGPLSRGALYRILSERLGTSLTRPLLGRIEHAAGGNPFYALELARALDADPHPAYGEGLPVPDDLRELLSARLGRLPAPTRDELLKVSALAQPTVALVDVRALGPAEEAGVAIVRADGRVEFSHPLYASAVYAGASRERRRRLHDELASRTSDVEERARHLSLANDGPDARIAAVLEEAADRARRRGASDVAAELDEQAARFTRDEDLELKHERLLRAGRDHLQAGDRERARALGELVTDAQPAALVRAHALHLLAETRVVEGPGVAVPLLEQALDCAGSDAGLAAELETSLGLLRGGLFDPAGAELHLARAVELAETADEPALLAEAIAVRALTRLVFGMGLDEEALERALTLEDHDREVRFQLRPSFNAAQAYAFAGRIGPARELLVRVRDEILALGAESELAWVLGQLGTASWLAGDLDAADAEASDAVHLAVLTDQELFQALALLVRAMVGATRGDAATARAAAAEAFAISERIGWPHGVAQARWAQGFLALAEGDPAAAVRVLEPLVAQIEAFGVYEWPIASSIPEAVEALVTTGEVEQAARLTDALAAWGQTFDRPWALATSGRCRALLAAAAGDLEAAEAAAEQALVEHTRLGFPLEDGRTRLVLGQIQRRRRHERAARETLGEALATFERIGARPWADRAVRELGSVPVRRVAANDLTPAEERVAELAAGGLTNREVASTLFISPKTVEANLTRVYRKLGVHSRAELGARMVERKRGEEQAKT
jgi:DNA-binding CsgD family transcriptional regulator